ncbi:PREDICTED: uncharacterized protein LOC108661586 [Theobroma cacao]|uniref:Uncharacterized protein LOC108661586 n=1 Tax=Theobroma cacao TaxID=3641 RepID=A0AB32W8Z9_THECC|nr:PREDICTED: uncharacterized protein LOC108661586 [Theobroma cacao]
MSEQSFNMAMSDGEKTLSKVETVLKQLSIEESRSFENGKQVCQFDESGHNEKESQKIKGIKCKPKNKGDKSSQRQKNALEKAKRKKRLQIDKLVETPLVQEDSSQIAHTLYHSATSGFNQSNSC